MEKKFKCVKSPRFESITFSFIYLQSPVVQAEKRPDEKAAKGAVDSDTNLCLAMVDSKEITGKIRALTSRNALQCKVYNQVDNFR